MSRNSILIWIGLFITFLIGSLSFPYVSASDPQIFEIHKNYQSFIDFKKHPGFKNMYLSGEVSFTMFSQDNIQLIEKNNALVFFSPIGVHQASGILEITTKDKISIISLFLDIKKDPLDYNITEDMFELSLQEKSLSCESAAAADIIESFIGKEVNEDQIIELLPKGDYYNILPEEHPQDIQVWGNPELGFVGHIDSSEEVVAKQKFMTGYGVYEAPISDIYQDLGFYSEIFNRENHDQNMTPEKHLSYLLEKLQSGSMVQLWGDWCTTLEYDDGILENKQEIPKIDYSDFISAKNSCYDIDLDRTLHWKYYNNSGELTQHTGLNGEHAFILLGWKGDIENPTYIRVWDTDTGYHLYPTAEWMRKWEAMDYRSIIVSKKDS